MRDFNVDKLINDLMTDLAPRQRVIISERYGLQGKEPSTLQEIGDRYGVSRERIRQIESQILKNLQPRLQEEAVDLLNFVTDYLERLGGVRREENLMRDLIYHWQADRIKNFAPKTKFIFEVTGSPLQHREDEHFHTFWYLTEEHRRNFFDFINQFIDFLKIQPKDEILEKKSYLPRLKDLNIIQMISISKKIGYNRFGDFGLTEWPEIRPKTIRDKAYLALKKHGQPLHFTQVASSIHILGIDEKPPHIQTVHNELIKDERFVLVGRGLYGLREHGFEPGTVRDILIKILSKKKALPLPELIKLVKQKKFVKEATILINLQNKNYFQKLKNGKYALKH